jgi:hypothetical protein
VPWNQSASLMSGPRAAMRCSGIRAAGSPLSGAWHRQARNPGVCLAPGRPDSGRVPQAPQLMRLPRSQPPAKGDGPWAPRVPHARSVRTASALILSRRLQHHRCHEGKPAAECRAGHGPSTVAGAAAMGLAVAQQLPSRILFAMALSASGGQRRGCVSMGRVGGGSRDGCSYRQPP